ncbi:MAG TPA: ABC transporter substrate-binding protein [bacterium]|nr:ABC transporter substrate-binding protein [bacterium]
MTAFAFFPSVDSMAAEGQAIKGTAGSGARGRKIKIAWAAAAADYAPYWVALENGLFKKNGVEVDLMYLSPAASAQALAAGDIDLLSSSGEGINLRAEGVDVKYLATVNHYLIPFGLYARQGGPSAISSAGFAGKSLAVTSPGSATDIFARYLLSQYQVDLSKVQFVYTQGIPAIYSGLASGKFDLGSLPVPAALTAESDKAIQTLSAVGKAKVPGTTASLMGKTDWIRAHETEAKGILRATLDAIAWSKAHSGETQQIIGKYLKMEDRKVLQGMYDVFSKVWGAPNLQVDLEGLRVAIQYSPNPKAKTLLINDLVYEDNKLAKSIK